MSQFHTCLLVFRSRLRNLPIIAFTLSMLAGNLHHLPVPTVLHNVYAAWSDETDHFDCRTRRV
jgi:hypothetical protein